MSDTLQIVCPDCNEINHVEIGQLSEQSVCGHCKQPLFNGTPLELSSKNFEQQITPSDLPVLVEFWAPWCGPCRMMSPMIEAVAKTLAPALRVAKLNTESEDDIAARYGIHSVPTLAIFRKGQLVKQRVGAADLGQTLDWARASIGSAD